MVIYITLYYTTIIAYATFYLFASFQDPIPWSTCNNSWNTQNCFISLRNLEQNATAISMSNSSEMSSAQTLRNKTTTPGDEYFHRYLLGIHKSTGLHDLGPIKFDITFCLALVYFSMYVLICNGVRGTGKAVYVSIWKLKHITVQCLRPFYRI